MYDNSYYALYVFTFRLNKEMFTNGIVKYDTFSNYVFEKRKKKKTCWALSHLKQQNEQ